MGTFRAIRIDKAEKGITAALTQFDEAELMEGDVTVAVEWSTLNYKDGLAVTGKAPVVRRFPMIAGIDFAGTVEQSSHPEWKAGDKVVCNGWGMGETHLGAYAEKARVKGDWLVRLPDGMSARDAMAIGTAGYTAMLSVLALEKHGLAPARGPVVVTGAAGGVGSVATAVLSKLGYHVIASTGRMSEADYLKGLGAAEVIDRAELAGSAKPLAKERWAGGVDSVGSTTLANLLSMTRYGGAVAACGLAVALDRVALAGGHLVEVLEVEGPQTPRAHDARAVAERLLEHREERSGDLDGRIELQHRSPARDAQQRAPTRALTEVAVRVVDQHARLARGELVETALRGFARSLIEDEHLAVGRDETKDAAQAARDVVRPLPREHADRPGPHRALGALVPKLARRCDGPARPRSEAPIGARHERATRAIVDPQAVELRAQAIRRAVVTRRARELVTRDGRERHRTASRSRPRTTSASWMNWRRTEGGMSASVMQAWTSASAPGRSRSSASRSRRSSFQRSSATEPNAARTRSGRCGGAVA